MVHGETCGRSKAISGSEYGGARVHANAHRALPAHCLSLGFDTGSVGGTPHSGRPLGR